MSAIGDASPGLIFWTATCDIVVSPCLCLPLSGKSASGRDWPCPLRARALPNFDQPELAVNHTLTTGQGESRIIAYVLLGSRPVAPDIALRPVTSTSAFKSSAALQTALATSPTSK